MCHHDQGLDGIGLTCSLTVYVRAAIVLPAGCRLLGPHREHEDAGLQQSQMQAVRIYLLQSGAQVMPSGAYCQGCSSMRQQHTRYRLATFQGKLLVRVLECLTVTLSWRQHRSCPRRPRLQQQRGPIPAAT
jgi:hypothetical protein